MSVFHSERDSSETTECSHKYRTAHMWRKETVKETKRGKRAEPTWTDHSCAFSILLRHFT